MSETHETVIRNICREHGGDRGRMMDVVWEVHRKLGCVSSKAMDQIANELNASRVEVESLVSFYAFYSDKPRGKIIIRLCDDVVDRMKGFERVARVFCEELGIELGETTPDGLITLETTPCIGMCDQAPAAMINDVIVTELSSDKAREIVKELRVHMNPSKLVHTLGDGNNAHDLVQSMVKNNIRKEGPVVFSEMNRGEAIRKALAITPNEVIRALKTARLRGRGGAGFPTGMKWEFARSAPGEKKYILCNADEGEPGTFKDRVILTERADRMFAGMTIAGYAIGAEEGILYLRAEYMYLRAFLEQVLRQRRRDNLLGKNILGRTDFSFDIRIQMGAGAYICGEETALISSCEGRRGDPLNRPPFPAQKGYKDMPTVVNNCETLCKVTRILEEGPATFNQYGSSRVPAPSCSPFPATASCPACTSSRSASRCTRSCARSGPRTPSPARSADPAARWSPPTSSTARSASMTSPPAARSSSSDRSATSSRSRTPTWTSSSRRVAATARPVVSATCCSASDSRRS
jgi:[NiFe] hydrogenase diaphorase moiety large subunit